MLLQLIKIKKKKLGNKRDFESHDMEKTEFHFRYI